MFNFTAYDIPDTLDADPAPLPAYDAESLAEFCKRNNISDNPPF